MVKGIFSKHKDLFGKPGTGIHSYRFLDTAIIDYIGTILLAAMLTILLGRYPNGKYRLSFVNSTITMFVIAIISHYLFGVST